MDFDRKLRTMHPLSTLYDTRTLSATALDPSTTRDLDLSMIDPLDPSTTLEPSMRPPSTPSTTLSNPLRPLDDSTLSVMNLSFYFSSSFLIQH